MRTPLRVGVLGIAVLLFSASEPSRGLPADRSALDFTTWVRAWGAADNSLGCVQCVGGEPHCPTGFHYDYTGLINAWFGDVHPWCIPYTCDELHWGPYYF